MSLSKLEKGREKFIQRSQALLDQRKFNRSGTIANNSRLTEIEEKLRMFGGLQQMEQEFIKDLSQNNQRLDKVIASVKHLMKVDPKTRKAGVSPAGRVIAKKGVEKDKSNKRLIERVQRAIHEQSPHFMK